MKETKHIDVFISRKSIDAPLAKEIYDFLTSKGLTVFESDLSLPQMGNTNYHQAIDDALEQAKHFIVLGSSREHFKAAWIQKEWRSFLNLKLAGRKQGNLLTVITQDIDLYDLPLSLRNYEVIVFEKGLQKLLPYLGVNEPKNTTPPTIKKEKRTDNKAILLFEKGEKLYDEKKNSEAYIFLLQAASLGHDKAQSFIGRMFYCEEGVNKDYRQAMLWNKKAAAQGNARAQNSIGTLYYSGQGVEQNKEKAKECFIKAANQGSQVAINNLKNLYGITNY